MVISSFEFWACLELVWYPYALGLVLEVNPEFVRMLWVWRTGCRHQGDVSACLARACSITGVPHLVTVPAPVLPSLSGNTKNTTSRCKKDVSRMIQHVYPESAWVFLSCSTESPPALTSWTLVGVCRTRGAVSLKINLRMRVQPNFFIRDKVVLLWVCFPSERMESVPSCAGNPGLEIRPLLRKGCHPPSQGLSLWDAGSMELSPPWTYTSEGGGEHSFLHGDRTTIWGSLCALVGAKPCLSGVAKPGLGSKESFDFPWRSSESPGMSQGVLKGCLASSEGLNEWKGSCGLDHC